MSDKLRKQIEVERQQLARLIEVHQPLIYECASRPPTDIELSALAFFLETFYSGIENIFKRIAVELDGSLPDGRRVASQSSGCDDERHWPATGGYFI